MVTVTETLQAAVEHHRSGEFEQAGSLYEQVLHANPNHPDALQLVGVMSHQMGRPYEAIQFIERAISVKPDVAEFHNNLAAAWMDASNPTEAARCCRRAIQIEPRYAEAHSNLGNALKALGDLRAAENECRRAVQLAPDRASSYFNLGNIQRDRNELDDAVASYRTAIRINPSHYQALNNLAQLLSRSGRLDDAQAACRKALDIAPDEPAILKNLAVIEAANGHSQEAIQRYIQAIRLTPTDIHAMNSLGLLLYEQDRLDEAGEILQHALRLHADFADAHTNLGVVYAAQGQRRAAVECYEHALQINPDSVETLCNLGVVLRELGEYRQASNCLMRAVRIAPDCAEAHNALGSVQQAAGETDEAMASFQTTVKLNPDFMDGLCNLAGLQLRLGNVDDSERLLRHVLERTPDSVAALNNLGNLLRSQGQLDEAERLLRRAVALNESGADLHNNLGTIVKAAGRIEDAIAELDRAIELDPQFIPACSNRLTSYQYVPEIDLKTLSYLHAQYDATFAKPLRAKWRPFTNNRDPQRPLRVGFVSSDFGCHPVGFLLVRGVEALDKEQFVTVCYSNRPLNDELTERIRSTTALWRDVCPMSDEQLAEQIRQDGIDILVDLAGHTAGNRALVFARKPAPVQVTWLGYVGTTGLTAMDYLLTDRFHVPTSAERFYVEQVVRLPESHFVFEPPHDSPAPGPLPLLEKGTATFASFNNPSKISASVIDLWADVLHRTPDSRLVLKYRGFDDHGVQQRYSQLIREAGIDPGRLDLRGWSPRRAMLEEYNGVDISLDPFPFTGGMTTLLSLWMGVPVITVAGETFASRQSMSFLTQLGLTELIARDASDYVERATALVADVDGLQSLRSTLRQRLLDSPLCNSDHFARSIESAFREMWRKWCQSDSPGRHPAEG